ncbi:alpha/beta hydrolase [uncultured Microbulbifer sp.]|uniref:alpha/beta fold hydrolase n=1 Tax=uncultured Microbulbifer sp. TaxID=348147 RepID=UPI002623FFB8|nr:alpha/beta hydrolase [uncultured Microbulbifer sp.]
MTQEFFLARDGKKLAFRWLPSEYTQAVLICMHGSTFNSQWYLMFGRIVQDRGITVCLPDWRGHGNSEGRPGDLDYQDQLQDDLQDLVNHLKGKGVHHFVLGGHSAGALVALRYLGMYGTKNIIAFFAIAPPLTQTDETRKHNYDTSGWGHFFRYFRRKRYSKPLVESELKNLPKMNLWLYWLALLIPYFRNLPVLHFPALGSIAGNQQRILDCSYNLLGAYNAKYYAELFSSIDIPCHFIVGEFDEVIDAHILYTVMTWFISPDIDSRLTEIPRANHMSAISASAKLISSWLHATSIFSLAVEV